MSQRTDRVDELLRQEIGTLLAKEVADPRIGFATITDVETSPDLRHAKVWVSVIGGRTDPTRPCGPSRHPWRSSATSWASACGSSASPTLHVHLDDSAERGTRVLHLLQELESGVEPGAITPVQRVAAHAGQAAAPRGRRRARGRASSAGCAPRDPARARRPQAVGPARSEPRRARVRAHLARAGAPRPACSPQAREPEGMSAPVDLSAFARDAVPEPALAARPRWPERARGEPREPGRRHAGRRDRHLPDRRGHGRPRDRRLHGPGRRRCTTSCPAIERFRTDPDPAEAYDLLVLADCASAERVGAVAGRNAGLFAALPRVIVDHHASNDRRRAMPTGSTRAPRRPASSSRCSPSRLGLPLDLGRRRARRRR